MRTLSRPWPWLPLVLLPLCFFPLRSARAVGEGQNGFPNWAERVVFEWTNRARCDPQYEMARCGTNCSDAACYQAQPPLVYQLALNRAARFHSDELAQQSYFAHDSACTVVPNIDALYPDSCNGAASCACVGGTKQCSSQCTTTGQRISLFGGNFRGENIASPTDPDRAFYLWLYEPYNKTTCAFDLGPPTNGHRWNLLTNGPALGAGVSGPAVTDFGSAPGAIPKVPSGAHYPRQSNQIEAWANWYDPRGGPTVAFINLDNTCYPLIGSRGSPTNGAWSIFLGGFGTGCHRYYFVFRDIDGTLITYPTTGSLGIGPAASCPDWDPARPTLDTSCDRPISNGGDGGTGGGDGGTNGGTDGGTDGGTSGGQGGCSCHLGRAPAAADGRASSAFVGLGLGLGLGLWARGRSQRR